MPSGKRRTIDSDFEGYLVSPDFGVFYKAKPKTIADLHQSEEVLVHTFKSGEYLFTQGEPSERTPLFIILKGGLVGIRHVYQQKDVPGNEAPGDISQIVALDTVGSVIGDVEYLIKDCPNALIPRGLMANETKASIMAMTETEALVIEGSARETFFQDEQVLRNTSKLLALKLLRRSARGDAMAIFHRKWPQVIEPLLHRLAQEPSRMGLGVESVKIAPKSLKDAVRLNCKIPQSVLAEALGVSPQTVSRAFKELLDKGRAAYLKDGIILVSKAFVESDPPGVSW